MSNVINVSNLTIDYGNERGIFNFNFNIEKGKCVALVGTNGSGKTTTLRTLMGFLKPNNGDAKINNLDSWKDAKEIKNDVSYVPGEINFPDVGSGDSFLNIQRGFYNIKDETYMDKLIDIFKLDTRVPLRRMSKGMKQKVALVCAFMKDSDIILLDEPSTGLDPLMRDNLIELILEEKKKGKTIFMSSHIFKEIEDTCDKVIFIDKGHIIDEIDMSQIKDNDNKEYKIIFEEEKELNEFMIKNEFETLKIENNIIHLNVLKKDINLLFDLLSNYKIKNLEYIPYSLEKYYEQYIIKGAENE